MAFDNIRLEKGMYQTSGRSFTQVLESLDPSEQYRGTAMEGLDAYQRQLKRFDIHVKGSGSDCVEKFFRTVDSAVLFPEFIARTVRAGLEEHNPLPSLLATTTNIDAIDYRGICAVPETASTDEVAEGAAIPAVQVKVKEKLIRLNKRGRMLVASYEAIRFQKLDLFAVMLRQIGQYIQQALVGDAIDVLISGDGNTNTAAPTYAIGTSPISGTSGTLAYAQLVEFWSQFAPYEMNTLLAGSAAMVSLLKVSELQNPLTGLNFQGTGMLASPLGATLVRCDSMPSGKLAGVDRRYALEMVQAGDITVDYDRLIDRQMERAAVTSLVGFSKISGEAARVLTI